MRQAYDWSAFTSGPLIDQIHSQRIVRSTSFLEIKTTSPGNRRPNGSLGLGDTDMQNGEELLAA